MPVTNERSWGRFWARCGIGLRCLGGLALVLVLTAATCTTGAGIHVEATPGSVARVVARTTREAYRTEATVSLGDVKVPLGTGAVDGDLFAATTDMERLVEATGGDLGAVVHEATGNGGGEMPPEDMTVKLIADCSTLYIKSTSYAHLHYVRHAGEDPGPREEILRLSKEWGRVDLGAFPELRPVDVSRTLTGYANPHPRELLRLLSDVAGVEELGEKTVRGEPLGGLTADVPIADLLEVLGKQPAKLVDRSPDPFTQDLVRRTLAMTVPVEVWINEEGLIHQISFELKADEIADETGEDRFLLAQRLRGVGIVEIDRLYTVDYFDYDKTVTIEVPDTTFELSKAAMMPSSAAG